MRTGINRVAYDQHLMEDRQLLAEMAQAGQLGRRDTVLEIGAGDGRLTRLLAAQAGRVIAVEIDEQMKRKLEKQKGNNTTLVFGNSLKLLDTIPFTKLVANPPYAILEPLLRKLAFLDWELTVLTLPERFAEHARGRKTPFGIFCHTFFDLRILKKVPRSAFVPEPRTDSVLAVLKKKTPSIESTFLSMESKRLKNALVETLCRWGCTRRQAKERVRAATDLPDTMIKDLSAAELERALMFIKGEGQ